MDFLDQLNPEQREAVLHVEGPLLILAGAGSGKTRVIAYRIAHLIGAGHADAHEVVAVTFTNKAAEEMRGRVEGLLGDACAGAWISTFHSMCARLLRREAPSAGLSRDFVIYDSSDQVSAIRQVMRDLKIDDSLLQPKVALGRISQAKNLMQGPEAFSGSANPRDVELGKLFEGYQRALAESNAVDFDDLLLRTVALFDSAGDVRARYARRFRFLLVDEYQDTNRPQYLLMRRLAEAHHNICVVGDPDQSIYKWRGADIGNIMDFEQDYPDAKVVRLERNYRSTQVILDAASAVIEHNRERKEKRLWTDVEGGDKVVCHQANDELEEADVVARTARAAVKSGSDTPMAVLYRTNAQSRVIEDALRREGIAYRIIGSVRFYERREIKDTLAYLKVLLNPDDDVSLRRIINVPARGVGKRVMDALAGAPAALQLSDDHGTSARSLWSRMVGGLDTGVFAGRAATSLRVFRTLMDGLREAAGRESPSTLIGLALDRSGYLQALREDRSDEGQARIENLAGLVSAAKEYELRDASPSLAGFVDQLSLLSETDESQGSTEAGVLMMTLHSAKGLEFPLVFITGLEDGLFPHSRASESQAELEEERRLFYVGMTRARRKLLVSWASRRRWYGEYRSSRPSRFLDEIPEELMDRVEPAAPSLLQPGLWPGAIRYGAAAANGRQTAQHRGRTSPAREAGPAYSYEDEDQSRSGTLRPGTAVRHARFGSGVVVSVEPSGGDLKVVVRFSSVGTKRLLASYAKLEIL